MSKLAFECTKKALCIEYDITKVKIPCLNGNKSYSAFKKYFPDLSAKYNCHKMPSTSPANARYSLDKLITEWNKCLSFINI